MVKSYGSHKPLFSPSLRGPLYKDPEWGLNKVFGLWDCQCHQYRIYRQISLLNAWLFGPYRSNLPKNWLLPLIFSPVALFFFFFFFFFSKGDNIVMARWIDDDPKVICRSDPSSRDSIEPIWSQVPKHPPGKGSHVILRGSTTVFC